MRPSWTRAWLATFIILVASAAIARNSHDTLIDVEERVLDWLLDDADTSFWSRADVIGSPTVAWIAVVVMAILVIRFDRVVALAFPVTLAFGVGVGVATRALVERPRPSTALADSASFPSLTVVHAGVWLGLGVLCMWWFGAPRLVWQVATEGAVVLLIATSIARIVEGEHWPSDTIGSALVITLALIGAAMALEARPRPKHLFSRARETEDEPVAVV